MPLLNWVGFIISVIYMKENKDKKSSGFQMIVILLQNLNRTLDLWLLAQESFYNILPLLLQLSSVTDVHFHLL